jgi:hypothetical protein
MRKGEQPNTIVGELVDQWGWRVELSGTLNPQTRTYALVGALSEPPEKLRIVAIDGEAKP